MDTSKGNANRIGGAVFLIGLGIIAFLDYWWPGVMFVSAAALIAVEWVETGGKIKPISSRIIGAITAVLIGLVGMIDIRWGSLWPVVLIVLGVGLLLRRDQQSD